MRTLAIILFLTGGLGDALAGNASGPLFNDLEGAICHPLDPAEKMAAVLFFYCQDCPISNNYAAEINRISASHTNFAFYIVQVDPDLTAAAAREHAKAYDLHVPVLLDPRHELVKRAKATVTPEAVVFGKQGRILYRGRIDDLYAALGKKDGVVTHHDLVEALEAIAAGKKVRGKKTQAIGCVIP